MEASRRLLYRFAYLDGLFVASDLMAVGSVAALAERGRSVPDDVAVVGFDDVPEAAYVRPALTTVHQDFELVGRRAVEVLLARLRDDEAEGAGESADVIPPRLIVRASTAPVQRA
jgi:DNA-binding LacI/PurR family transcriptional regulator